VDAVRQDELAARVGALDRLVFAAQPTRATHSLVPVARDTREDQYNVVFVSERLLARPTSGLFWQRRGRSSV
jgi:hypothetical protein